MKKPLLVTSLLTLSLGLTGCVTQQATSVSYRGNAMRTTICLVDNPDVKPQMFLSVRRALMDKGFYVQRIEAEHRDATRDCKQIVTYQADYDTAWSESTLRFAKVTLTEKGKHENVYSAQWDERGTQKPTLFDNVSDADVEIRQLIDRLFPSDIPWS